VVGVFVTLRGLAMKEFIDRLIFIDLPRMHKLTGLPLKSFDSGYNYNIGIERQDIFLCSKGLDLFGLNLSLRIVRSNSRKDSHALLKSMGFPLYPMGGNTNAAK
jgi:large subunit ribosomal protein L5